MFRVAWKKRGRKPAAVQHRHPVAKAQDFIEILADDEDGAAVLLQIPQRLVDRGSRPGVDPPCGLGGQEDHGVLEDLATDDEALQVAAGKA